ncbi:MAG: hypothetical protein JRH01_11790 [Deltaproteobacteria bacterium]|nr:hypothetical protein [Deltaproteobacteria bacterium]MBW2394325.1 hypothetical protein [Deltaproteobacteria bacterium]
MPNTSSRRPTLFEAPLRLSPGRAIGFIGPSIALTLGFLTLALTNQKGLILQGVLKLTPANATLFYSVVSAWMGLAIFPTACALAWKRIWLSQRVGFVEEGILLPSGFWSADEVLIPYLQLAEAAVVEIGSERLLTLSFPGRCFRIGSSWLPSEQAFDQVLERVQTGIQNEPDTVA